ncbi:MAG: hypothetical protein COA79_24630 [Planctomycetota bacterium]|nr:MAG: hypothetical protein COA79_24630 [Planctomycetota bacterium]
MNDIHLKNGIILFAMATLEIFIVSLLSDFPVNLLISMTLFLVYIVSALFIKRLKKISVLNYFMLFLMIFNGLFFIGRSLAYIDYIILFHGYCFVIEFAGLRGKNTLGRFKILSSSRFRYSTSFFLCLVPVYWSMNGSILNQMLGFLVLLISFGLFVLDVKNRRSYRKSISYSLFAILFLIISLSFLLSSFSKVVMVDIKQRMNNQRYQSTSKKTKRPGSSSQRTIGYSDDLTLSKKVDLKKEHYIDVYMKLVDKNDFQHIQPNRIYLKGASLDTFKNNRWSNKIKEKVLLQDGVDNLPDGIIRVQKTPTRVKAIEHEVFQETNSNGNLLAMPNIISLKVDKIKKAANDSYYFPEGNYPNLKYTVTSGYIKFNDIDDYKFKVGNKKKRFLSLEDEISLKIKATTRSIISMKSSDADKIESVLYYFKQNFRYSLKVINKKNLDPLENFFYHEKKGHCELFASACVIMLRSVGIPSRLCVGYYGGDYDDDKDIFIFYTDQAHAWVEVYSENYGWFVVDTSPATVSNLVLHGENRSALENFFDENRFNNMGSSNSTIFGNILSREGFKGVFKIISKLIRSYPVIAINLALLTWPISFFLTSWFLGFFRPDQNRRNRLSKKTPDYIKYLYQTFGGFKKGQTLIEYVQQLKIREKISDTELDDLLHYYYETRYEKRDASKDLEKTFSALISKLKQKIKDEVPVV